MHKKRRTWTRTIEKAKTAHWKEFLDSAGEGHLWKAISYTRARESYASIPPLRRETEEITDHTEKAKLLMETFFPNMAQPEDVAHTEKREEIPWVRLTEEEVHRALQAAKPMKAPGEDGLPMLVWKQLWQWLKEAILRLFTASVNLGYYPEQWKRAKIIVLHRAVGPADRIMFCCGKDRAHPLHQKEGRAN
jgi:hypothetical protein